MAYHYIDEFNYARAICNKDDDAITKMHKDYCQKALFAARDYIGKLSGVQDDRWNYNIVNSFRSRMVRPDVFRLVRKYQTDSMFGTSSDRKNIESWLLISKKLTKKQKKRLNDIVVNRDAVKLKRLSDEVGDITIKVDGKKTKITLIEQHCKVQDVLADILQNSNNDKQDPRYIKIKSNDKTYSIKFSDLERNCYLWLVKYLIKKSCKYKGENKAKLYTFLDSILVNWKTYSDWKKTDLQKSKKAGEADNPPEGDSHQPGDEGVIDIISETPDRDLRDPELLNIIEKCKNILLNGFSNLNDYEFRFLLLCWARDNKTNEVCMTGKQIYLFINSEKDYFADLKIKKENGIYPARRKIVKKLIDILYDKNPEFISEYELNEDSLENIIKIYLENFEKYINSFPLKENKKQL